MTQCAICQDTSLRWDLEYLLAFHCAPALEGVKAANLISVRRSRHQDLKQAIRRQEQLMKKRGIRFFILSECTDRILLLVYNRTMLRAQLRSPEYAELLRDYGYPSGTPLDIMLRRLAWRTRRGAGEYPHEIGAFLGYPVCDIRGFIRCRGRGFRLCGYWKVYENQEQAEKLFHTYDTVRGIYCNRVSQGEKIHNIYLGGNCYEQGSGNLLVGNG